MTEFFNQNCERWVLEWDRQHRHYHQRPPAPTLRSNHLRLIYSAPHLPPDELDDQLDQLEWMVA
jgi:hypothetical protein